MNFGVLEENRVICRFNLRGICRFGTRCRNIHQSAEKMAERLNGEMEIKVPTREKPHFSVASASSSSSSQGACALSPTKSKELKTYRGDASDKENAAAAATGSSIVHDDDANCPAAALDAQSQHEDKTCGICFDAILQKAELTEQTFGILPNCNHCFCFSCIRKWRQSKEFELDVAKACPECRVASDFVYPSRRWVDSKEEKEAFIGGQKRRMKSRDCRYFRRGDGKCPFGNTCLYAHRLPNGKQMDVGPPRPRRKRRGSGIDTELVHQILFWLNDSDLEDDDDDDDFELDLSDPCIAMQYYEPGDIRRYIAMERLMRGSDDDDDNDLDPLFL